MENIQERSGKLRIGVSRLLAALVLAVLFSWPATAAINRFTDDHGTLHITNESAESTANKAPAITPVGRGPRPGGPAAFPPAAPALPPPKPPEPEAAPPVEEQVQEEPVSRVNDAQGVIQFAAVVVGERQRPAPEAIVIQTPDFLGGVARFGAIFIGLRTRI